MSNSRTRVVVGHWLRQDECGKWLHHERHRKLYLTSWRVRDSRLHHTGPAPYHCPCASILKGQNTSQVIGLSVLFQSVDHMPPKYSLSLFWSHLVGNKELENVVQEVAGENSWCWSIFLSAVSQLVHFWCSFPRYPLREMESKVPLSIHPSSSCGQQQSRPFTFTPRI